MVFSFLSREPFPDRMVKGAGSLLLTLSLLGFTSCSTVKVSTDKDRLVEEGVESARSLRGILDIPGETGQSIARLIRIASRVETKGQAEAAAAQYLASAIETRELLASGKIQRGSEAEANLLKLHNSALGLFANNWSVYLKQRHEGTGPARFVVDGTVWEAALSEDSDYRPDYFDYIISATATREKGVVAKERAGYGAALVGVRMPRAGVAEDEFFPPEGLHTAVTLVLETIESEGETPRALFSLKNPMTALTVELDGELYPLRADFSAPIAHLLSGQNEFIRGLAGFIHADRTVSNSGIYLTEPYDPTRTPVFLTHGLIAAPIAWRDMIPELTSEGDLSTRFQVMLFSYPSAYIIPESTQLFREELAKMRGSLDPEGDDPLSTEMVAVGHSMGGVITHMMVAEMGDLLWNQTSDIPLEAWGFPEEVEEDVRELMFYEPDPAIDRAIFIATPHRGADLADKNFVTNFAARLANLPREVVSNTTAFMTTQNLTSFRGKAGRTITSVNSLRSDSPVAKALDQAPYKDGVIYHSIIGDRGKGDTPDSSDGVVDYWSSHQKGAASELIVPSSHGAHRTEEAVAEVKRILRVEAGLE